MSTVDRILTTHGGSLPRSERLLDVLMRVEAGDEVDRAEFRRVVAADADEAIGRQLDAGVDIGGDGELPRIGFSNYVKDRMSGFGGVADRGPLADFVDFPKYAELKQRTIEGGAQLAKTATIHPVPQAQGRVAYDPERRAVEEEMDLFGDALARAGGDRGFVDTFVTAASPGIISTTLLRAPDNPAYADDGEYLAELATELRKEYEYIVEQGHILQIDAPDLAMERQIMFRERPLGDFLERAALHVEILNESLSAIPRERVRMHVCWGNYDGPHVGDVALEPLLPILYEANVGAISLPAANPRHQHEHKVLRSCPPPESLVLIPGMIDVTYNYVEHPEVVADRICQWADAIGDPSRVIAGTDCGFSTFAGNVLTAEDVVWEKLEALSEGARIATARIWG
ncbi:MAG: hypothetical protein WEB79_12795 [Thermoleophilaceae bacterium]